MIRFTVIGGYLGAGKTTLLNRILSGNHGIRFALLINDFGEINIDAGLIKSESESQINLTNGCICCSLTDGFYEAIESLCMQELKPEHIIVEASGVADVANLAQYGYAPELELDGVLVMADAETVVQKANDKYVASTVRRQLAAADLIVLNKTDLVPDDVLSSRLEFLRDNFDEPKVLQAKHADVPLELLLGVHAGDQAGRPTGHEPHEHYETWSFRYPGDIGINALAQFSQQLPGEIIRSKGIARIDDGTHQSLQVVGKRNDVSKVHSEQAGINLVAIALSGQLDQDYLDRLAHSVFIRDNQN